MADYVRMHSRSNASKAQPDQPGWAGGWGVPDFLFQSGNESELLLSCRWGDLQAPADVLKGASVEQELLQHVCCSFKNNGAKKKKKKKREKLGADERIIVAKSEFILQRAAGQTQTMKI